MNDCGGCSECCKGNLSVTVKGRRLRPGRHCRYLSSRGCSIHDRRPKVCRRFLCGYLFDMPDRFRPDKCGAIIVINRHGPGIHSIVPTMDRIPEETHELLAGVFTQYVYRYREGGGWKLGLYGTERFKADMLCQINIQQTN